MIHIFLGTKAQLIKTAPVIRRLDAEGVPYRLIDSGQHADLSQALRRELGIREPDARLRTGHSIATVPEGLWWLLRLLAWATVRSGAVRRELFADQDGICVIHGDTASTLVSLYLAKRAGLRVAHLEAGLRSYSIWHPFPEELIRLIAMRWSDLLFAPSEWAFDNLRRMRVRGECVNLGANTSVEAVRDALARPAAMEMPREPYAVMTIHRMETIYHARRLRMAVDLAFECSAERLVCFIMHPPTHRQLARRGWLRELERHPRVRILSLVAHHDFLHLLRGAEFLVTDGGSVQEESVCLHVPCLVLRQRTERHDGLTTNVRLVPFDREAAREFVRDYRSLRQPMDATVPEPSRVVVERLRLWLGGESTSSAAVHHHASAVRSWGWTLLGVAAIAVVLVRRWHDAPSVTWRWQPGWLLVSVVLLLASLEWGAWLWGRLLSACGIVSPRARSTAIWFRAMPSKYLPGGLWNLVGRLDLCRLEGWPVPAVVLSMALEQVISLAVAVLLAGGWWWGGRWWWIGVLACAAALLIVARPSPWVASLRRRLVGAMEGAGDIPSRRRLVMIAAGYAGFWVLHGLAFAALAASLLPVDWCDVPKLMSAFAGSFVIGYLVLVAPAGLGIREGVLATSLSGQWPSGMALAVSVIARLWMVSAELIALGWHVVADHRREVS